MNRGVYLLFLYICSSLAATTLYVAKKSSTTIPMSTKGSSVSTTATTSTKKTIIKTTITSSTSTAITSSISTTTTSSTSATTTSSTSITTTPSISTTTTSSTSTATTESTSETSLTPLPNSLNEKVDYQIYQTRLLTDIVEDNRIALKRLISMMSHLLNNSVNIITNYTIDSEKQHIENMRQVDQVVQLDNDTLHVSFGTNADPSRYPWTVAVRGNDRNRCGGTLIDDQHVLTAAHCIGTRITTVSLGSHLYHAGEEVKANFYCLHNAYSSSGFYRNDIAIIRLVKPVTVRLPKRVSTINLCNRGNSVNTAISGNTVNLWMVGWGLKILKDNEIEPDALQEAQVTLADRSMCKGSNRYTDMCVQSRSNTGRTGACIGDSGSGLFQQTILTNQWCVLGVISSSNSDFCNQTQFTTYAQASSQDYVEWFKDVLDRKKTFDDLQKMERCKPKTWEQEFCRWYAC